MAIPALESGGEPPAEPGLPADRAPTHVPNDSRCRECMQTKAQNTPHRRRRKEQVVEPSPGDGIIPESVSDMLAADHFVIAALDGPMYRLGIKERLRCGRNVCSQAARNTHVCMSTAQQVSGSHQNTKSLHFDREREIVSLARILDYLARCVDVHRLQSTGGGRARRASCAGGGGTMSVLMESGLSHACWPKASRCYGRMAWERTSSGAMSKK